MEISWTRYENTCLLTPSKCTVGRLFSVTAASNLCNINDICAVMTSKDPNYNYYDLAKYVNWFFNLCIKQHLYIMHCQTDIASNDNKSLTLTAWRDEPILLILVSLILLLSFCSNLSTNGLRKIAILLTEMQQNFIHELKGDHIRTNQTRYYFVITWLTYRINATRIQKLHINEIKWFSDEVNTLYQVCQIYKAKRIIV